MSTSSASASKDKKAHVALSKVWLTDPIKGKYISGEVGDIDFICEICQCKLKCESAYDRVNWHEKSLRSISTEKLNSVDMEKENAGDS